MPSYLELQLYIGGEWRRRDGAPVINPADESPLGTVPHATRTDLDDALDAAAKGFHVWRNTSPAKRAEIIQRAAQLCRERADADGVAITLEQGKPLAQARLEIIRGCEIIDWDATEGRRVYGRIIPSEPGMRNTVLRQPIGVVAAFSPWNFPMSSPARKVAGALSSGCSIILKASEETPAGAHNLVRAFADAGLPPGVLNLVFGVPSGVSTYLIGQALMERVVYDEGGQFLTGSFTDYALPRASDAIHFQINSHPVPAKTNPRGAKGCGEARCAGSLPAVMNAVVDALSEYGIRHIDMPATPFRVWQTIQAARAVS
jgi:succinate-semialdehyde dehydrogenase / glutarate-semialdehyde dehydrogenase